MPGADATGDVDDGSAAANGAPSFLPPAVASVAPPSSRGALRLRVYHPFSSAMVAFVIFEREFGGNSWYVGIDTTHLQQICYRWIVMSVCRGWIVHIKVISCLGAKVNLTSLSLSYG